MYINSSPKKNSNFDSPARKFLEDNDRFLENMKEYVQSPVYSQNPDKGKGFITYINNTPNLNFSVKISSKDSTEIQVLFNKNLEKCLPIYRPFCLTSRALTKLIDWRNDNAINEKAKVLITELITPLLFVSGLVETAAYGVLAFGNYAIGRKSTWSCLLESSALTLMWSASVFSYHNFCKDKLESNEFVVREKFNEIQHSGMSLFYVKHPRCLTSVLMAKLLNWRNTDAFNGKISDIHDVANKILLGLKVLITELVQPLLIVSAIVEAVAYSALTLKEYAIGREYTWSYLLESSVSTLLWTVSVFFYYNLFCQKLQLNEFLFKEEFDEDKNVVLEKVWQLIS